MAVKRQKVHETKREAMFWHQKREWIKRNWA